MPSKKQIKLIHTAIHQLGIDDETYRTMLSAYGVTSSKELTYPQARDLIEQLQELGFDLKERKYREGMITPRQMAYIKYLWRENPNVKHKAVASLEAFVKRITGLDRLDWLPREKVQKVIKAIENIQSKQPSG